MLLSRTAWDAVKRSKISSRSGSITPALYQPAAPGTMGIPEAFSTSTPHKKNSVATLATVRTSATNFKTWRTFRLREL